MELSDRILQLRRARQHLLAEDERWLTNDDLIQPGDCYMANEPHWWHFDGPHCGGPAEVGKPVGWHRICYTPKGKKIRIGWTITGRRFCFTDLP